MAVWRWREERHRGRRVCARWRGSRQTPGDRRGQRPELQPRPPGWREWCTCDPFSSKCEGRATGSRAHTSSRPRRGGLQVRGARPPLAAAVSSPPAPPGPTPPPCTQPANPVSAGWWQPLRRLHCARDRRSRAQRAKPHRAAAARSIISARPPAARTHTPTPSARTITTCVQGGARATDMADPDPAALLSALQGALAAR